jgi:hypothetical protein
MIEIDNYNFAGIISQGGSGQDMYVAMTEFVDGEVAATNSCTIILDDFSSLLRMLKRVQTHLQMLSRYSHLECKLCSTIRHESVSHGMSGCPCEFNICYKCFGHHIGKSCREPYFKVPSNYCWKCWLPLFPIFGVQFHPRSKDDIGPKCKQSASDYLKPLTGHFFYKRDIASITCPAIDLKQYQQWLFHQSETSVSGNGQVPNILFLLDAMVSGKL